MFSCRLKDFKIHLGKCSGNRNFILEMLSQFIYHGLCHDGQYTDLASSVCIIDLVLVFLGTE